MVTVNCSSLPANLIESELFGREKGAFTGAGARQIGRFEVNNGAAVLLGLNAGTLRARIRKYGITRKYMNQIYLSLPSTTAVIYSSYSVFDSFI